MVFRRDNNKVDSFQRQMNALRRQIGDEEQQGTTTGDDRERNPPPGDRGRQPRQAGDEGYSFGSFPSSGIATGQPDETDASDAPAIPEMPQADQQVSIIAAGTTWQGDLDTQGSVHVYGKANGSIKATDDIWIADGAEVDARVEADRIVVGGELTGHVAARARFEALPKCEVHADIDAPTFVVHEGATVNGKLSMGTAASSAESGDRSRPGPVIQRRARRSS